MYEGAQQAAYQEKAQYANLGAIQGNAIGLNQAPKPPISQALIQELQSLLEKAKVVENRQVNLKDRIFGSSPCAPETSGKVDIQPNGFLHEANSKIQMLHVTLDRVIQNCVELERLA